MPEEQDTVSASEKSLPASLNNGYENSSGAMPNSEGISGKMPKEMRAMFELVTTQFTRQSGERAHPLYDKITSEHIPLIIQSVDRDAKLRFDDAQRQRISMLLCFAAILAVAVFLVIQLGASNPALLKELFQYMIVALGGFGGGYGYSELRRKRNE